MLFCMSFKANVKIHKQKNLLQIIELVSLRSQISFTTEICLDNYKQNYKILCFFDVYMVLALYCSRYSLVSEMSRS